MGLYHTCKVLVTYISVYFMLSPPCSNSRWLLLQPSPGVPGGGGWLCDHVPQHGRRPHQAFSFLQKVHLPNSPERSR